MPPMTGPRISRARRRSPSWRPDLARAGAGRARAAGSSISGGLVVARLLHLVPYLSRRSLRGLLRRHLAGERRVQVGAEDRLDGVPLVGARPPVGTRLQRLGQRREVGVLLVEGGVVEQAQPGRDAALGDVLPLD